MKVLKILVLLFILISLSCVAYNSKKDYVYTSNSNFKKEIIASYNPNISFPRQIVSPDDFLIMPWGNRYTGTNDDDLAVREMGEMGFNTTCFISADAMKYAKKYGLGGVLNNRPIDNSIADVRKRAEKWAQDIKAELGEDLDAVYMVSLRDEPTYDEKTAEELAVFCDVAKEKLGVKPFVNLFPSYAADWQWGTETYKEYLDNWADALKLDYISYDHYPFSLGHAPNIPGMTYNEGGAGFNENGFYGNLEAVRDAALRHNIKFVNIIQSVGALHWPVPDDYIIHVQGWSTLAYGGGGLAYFTLYTPAMGNWRDAPYDEYGMKSPTYRYVTHMNYAINNIAPVYTKLKSVNVFHIGNVPLSCHNQKDAKLIKELNLVPINGEVNACVGEFTDGDGKEYAIIVNKNPLYSLMVSKIEFSNSSKIVKVNERSVGDLFVSFAGEGVYIAPGHGVLVKGE